MELVLERAWMQIENYIDFVKDLSLQEDYLRSKQEQRARVANFYAMRSAVAGVAKEMLLRVVTDMVREVCR